MGIDLGSIEFYTGPSELGGPDDLDAAFALAELERVIADWSEPV
jgi:hypothetical protein